MNKDVGRQRALRGAGSVFQTTVHGKIRWCASISAYDANGKRAFVRGFGSSPAEAVQRRTANLTKRLAKEGKLEVQPRKTVPTVAVYMETWLDAHNDSQMNETSKKRHRRRLEQWILPHLNVRLDELTGLQIQTWLYSTLPERSAGPSAIVNAYKTLSALINHAVRFEVLESTPLRSVTKPTAQVAVRADDDKYVSKRVNLVKNMLKWLQQEGNDYADLRTRILFMFFGLRRAELLGLEWSCVTNLNTPNRAKITIRQQLKRSEVTGKWYIDPTTKQKRNRVIPLPEPYRLALVQEKAKGRNEIAQEDWQRDLIFLTPKGKHVSYNQYADDWRKVLSAYINKSRENEAELQNGAEYFRPHAMRRITVTILADSGIDMNVAREILGHKTLAMTEYYLSVSTKAKQGGAQAIADYLE